MEENAERHGWWGKLFVVPCPAMQSSVPLRLEQERPLAQGSLAHICPVWLFIPRARSLVSAPAQAGIGLPTERVKRSSCPRIAQHGLAGRGLGLHTLERSRDYRPGLTEDVFN